MNRNHRAAFSLLLFLGIFAGLGCFVYGALHTMQEAVGEYRRVTRSLAVLQDMETRLEVAVGGMDKFFLTREDKEVLLARGALDDVDKLAGEARSYAYAGEEIQHLAIVRDRVSELYKISSDIEAAVMEKETAFGTRVMPILSDTGKVLRRMFSLDDGALNTLHGPVGELLTDYGLLLSCVMRLAGTGDEEDVNRALQGFAQIRPAVESLSKEFVSDSGKRLASQLMTLVQQGESAVTGMAQHVSAARMQYNEFSAVAANMREIITALSLRSDEAAQTLGVHFLIEIDTQRNTLLALVGAGAGIGLLLLFFSAVGTGRRSRDDEVVHPGVGGAYDKAGAAGGRPLSEAEYAALGKQFAALVARLDPHR